MAHGDVLGYQVLPSHIPSVKIAAEAYSRDYSVIYSVNKHLLNTFYIQCHLVQFSHSVVSDSLRPHESQQARPPCPSPTPGVHSDSCPILRVSEKLIFSMLHKEWGFPGGATGKEPTCQYRRHKRHRFDPWVRKIPWRRAW